MLYAKTRHPPMDLDCDVVVIGGGPAGSTVSTLLAEKGYRVTVLEKCRHPRFHIGESLLPRNMPILRKLGVLDQVRGIGVVKRGADFSAPGCNGHVTFDFSAALCPDENTAFQVTRAEFDEILLRNARSRGVDVLEQTEAMDIRFSADRVAVSLRNVDGGAPARDLTARFLIDASGRDTFVGSKLGLKNRDPRHNSAAVFSHFTGVQRRAGDEAGNISVYWFDHGWFWLIPLGGERTSVGMVCDPAFLKDRRGDLAAFLCAGFARAPDLEKRMANAQPIEETRAAGNFSYRSKHIYGDRYLMVGDAYAFIDPVFSSGVYIAMQSAVYAADAVDGYLAAPNRARRLFAAYERRVKRGISGFSWFIYRFTDPAMRYLFMHPSNRFGIQSSVISVLSGDVFGRTCLWPRLALFRLLFLAAKTADRLRLGPRAGVSNEAPHHGPT